MVDIEGGEQSTYNQQVYNINNSLIEDGEGMDYGAHNQMGLRKRLVNSN